MKNIIYITYVVAVGWLPFIVGMDKRTVTQPHEFANDSGQQPSLPLKTSPSVRRIQTESKRTDISTDRFEGAIIPPASTYNPSKLQTK